MLPFDASKTVQNELLVFCGSLMTVVLEKRGNNFAVLILPNRTDEIILSDRIRKNIVAGRYCFEVQ